MLLWKTVTGLLLNNLQIRKEPGIPSPAYGTSLLERSPLIPYGFRNWPCVNRSTRAQEYHRLTISVLRKLWFHARVTYLDGSLWGSGLSSCTSPGEGPSCAVCLPSTCLSRNSWLSKIWKHVWDLLNGTCNSVMDALLYYFWVWCCWLVTDHMLRLHRVLAPNLVLPNK